MGISSNEKFEISQTFHSLQNKGAVTSHRTGAGTLFHKRGQTISVVQHHGDYRGRKGTYSKDSASLAKPVVAVNLT